MTERSSPECAEDLWEEYLDQLEHEPSAQGAISFAFGRLCGVAAATPREIGVCPICSGDCASANPPMIYCPVREVELLRGWQRARLETESILYVEIERLRGAAQPSNMREALEVALAFIDTALVADENPTMSKRAVVKTIRNALSIPSTEDK